VGIHAPHGLNRRQAYRAVAIVGVSPDYLSTRRLYVRGIGMMEEDAGLKAIAMAASALSTS
jgi:hypothetical protein